MEAWIGKTIIGMAVFFIVYAGINIFIMGKNDLFNPVVATIFFGIIAGYFAKKSVKT